eukprot:1724838-Pleurochrysis_carterae.AAC.7
MAGLPIFFPVARLKEWAKVSKVRGRREGERRKQNQSAECDIAMLSETACICGTSSSSVSLPLLFKGRLGYIESIYYNNMKNGHSSKATSLGLAPAAAAEIPILSQGSIVCVLPNEYYWRDGGAAFWIEKVEKKEETDTGDRLSNPFACLKRTFA